MTVQSCKISLVFASSSATKNPAVWMTSKIAAA